jgi:uncharacterized protein (TIGR03435 family)
MLNRCGSFAVMFVALASAWAQAPAGLKEFAIQPNDSAGHFSNSFEPARVEADRIGLRSLIGYAYGVPPVRVLGPGWLDDQFRVAARPQPGDEAQFLTALQLALADRLHLRVERATKEMPVYVLKVLNPDSPKLLPASGDPSVSGSDGKLSVVNTPISSFETFLTGVVGKPVIDETGLKASYTFNLLWQAGDLDSLGKTIREQLGLALLEDRRKVEVLVVDRN